MPSFLSKVFGRKKDDKGSSPRSPGQVDLLGGKFEAVSPTVSPSALDFPEYNGKINGHAKEKSDSPFGLFKVKSRPSSPETKYKKPDDLPHLSLNLAVAREDPTSRVFGAESLGLLTDVVIGERRLSPGEALVLVKACSQAITLHGLETLGIMHPHWYSASPDVQRRLISLFILSLSPHSPSPSTFVSEVNSTRSSHDVAAVLRWGLRHLKLEGNTFGTDDTWYTSFFDEERAADYPASAFTDKLAPKLPKAHLELLTAILEVLSSLAAHAEENSTSGSKLSKLFGLWLLTAQRVEGKDDWLTFYERWERTGRMLEHIFLARIRDESVDQRMPIRLLELVRQYPYTKGLPSPTTDLHLLPRPRFTTRLDDALFVRIETELPSEKFRPKSKIHPLQLVADAFSITINEGEYTDIWGKIIAASKDGSNPSPLSSVLADETIRFLSLVPRTDIKVEKEAKSPTFSVISPSSPGHRRSFSLQDKGKSPGANVNPTNGHVKPATDPSPLSPISSTDWFQFSSSGFIDVSPSLTPLASTLFDQDIEKTTPPPSPPPSRRPSNKRLGNKRSRTTLISPASPGRKSLDVPRSTVTESQDVSPAAPKETPLEEPPTLSSKAALVKLVQVDEAFVDFWSDALLDPISAAWPAFVICKLKSSLVPELIYGTETEEKKTLQWLVLEQTYTLKPPPIPVSPPSAEEPVQRRSASPSQSINGKRRFSFWSASRASTSSIGSLKNRSKQQEKGPKVGEMGEVLEEEDPKEKQKRDSIVRVRIPSPKPRKSVEVARKPVPPIGDVVASTKEEQIPKEAKANGEGVLSTGPVAPVAAAAAVATGVLGAAAVVSSLVEDAKTKEVEAAADSADKAPTDNVPAVETVEPALPTAQTDLAETNGDVALTSEVEQTQAKDEPPPSAALTAVEASVNDAAPVEKVVDEPKSDLVAPVVQQPAVPIEEVVQPSVALGETIPAAIDETPVEEAPVVEEAPILEEAPVVEEALAVEEAPVVKETPVVDEEPVVEEAPALEETSTVEEAPVVEEALVPGESIAVEEAPVVEGALDVEEAPVVKETLDVEEALVVEEVPVVEDEVLVADEAIAVEEAPIVEAPAVEAPVIEEAEGNAREVSPVEEAPAVINEPTESLPVTEEAADEKIVGAPIAEEVPISEESPLVAPLVTAEAEDVPVAQEEPVVAETLPVEETSAVVEVPAVEETTATEAAFVEEPPKQPEEPAVEASAVPFAEEAPAIDETVEEGTPLIEVPEIAPVASEVGAVEITASEGAFATEEVAVEPPTVEEVPDLHSEVAPFEEVNPVDEPAPVGDPATVEAFAVEQQATVEEPASDRTPPAEESAVVEEPTIVEEPVVVEEPAVVGEPAVAEEPAAVEEPALIEEPAVVEEPTTEEPAVLDEPAAIEKPAVVGEPVVLEESADSGDPTVIGEPLPSDEAPAPSDVEPAAPHEATAGAQETPDETPAPVDIPAPAEKPLPVEETVVVEEASSIEEPAVETPTPVDGSAPVEEQAVEEPATVEAQAPLGEPSPVEDAAAVADATRDEGSSVEEAQTLEETAVVDEPALEKPFVADAAPVVVAAVDETPAEDEPAVEESPAVEAPAFEEAHVPGETPIVNNEEPPAPADDRTGEDIPETAAPGVVNEPTVEDAVIDDTITADNDQPANGNGHHVEADINAKVSGEAPVVDLPTETPSSGDA